MDILAIFQISRRRREGRGDVALSVGSRDVVEAEDLVHVCSGGSVGGEEDEVVALTLEAVGIPSGDYCRRCMSVTSSIYVMCIVLTFNDSTSPAVNMLSLGAEAQKVTEGQGLARIRQDQNADILTWIMFILV